MFKLLIVDDEIFTREGIIEQIPWDRLGISEVQQAFDGVNALEIAASYNPDILLTDVRMPRMDGIELSFKLREVYPSCEIIFMSGYSDKEYLKSAIKLKAVSYVEKPIDLDELQAAIESAVASKSKEVKLNESIKPNIASELINKNMNLDKIKHLLGSEQFASVSEAEFVTLIINFNSFTGFNREDLLSKVEGLIIKEGLNSFCCQRDDDKLILHLYAAGSKRHLLKRELVDRVCTVISEYISSTAKFFICVGSHVNGIKQVYSSYEAAVEALGKTFFYSYGSIIYSISGRTSSYKLNENVVAHFVKYLSLEDKHQSIFLIKRLTAEIRQHTSTSVNYVKEVYYKIWLQLIRFSSERNIQLSENFSGSQSAFESFAALSTIFELEQFIEAKLEELFLQLEDKNSKIDPIANIMKYINDNFSDPNLSLPLISKNTYLTPSYICKIFKDQTGTTINKYIGEYRLNKAKELLKNQDITINDIAAKVGYGDGNYFAKIFKKETGLTPSDYRKKYLL